MPAPTIATGQTRQRGEAIAAAIEAHAPFQALKQAGIFKARWNASRNLKMGLADKLAAMIDNKVKRVGGILITVTPFGGKNVSTAADKVLNDTSFEVTMWQHMSLKPEDSALPDPLDTLDELQRVLATIEFTYPQSSGVSGNARTKAEGVTVSVWEEVADPTFLAYQVSIACRVLLGEKGS